MQVHTAINFPKLKEEASEVKANPRVLPNAMLLFTLQTVEFITATTAAVTITFMMMMMMVIVIFIYYYFSHNLQHS
jgi:hypothetical protein